MWRRSFLGAIFTAIVSPVFAGPFHPGRMLIPIGSIGKRQSMLIFNSSSHSPQPVEFTRLLKPANLVDWADFWPDGSKPQALPLEADVCNAVRDLPNAPTTLNIEHYPMNESATDQELEQSRDWLLQILAWCRSERPDLEFGWYNIPNINFQIRFPAHQDPEHSVYVSWRRVTETLAPVGHASDFTAPSMYMHFNKDTQPQFPNAVQDHIKLNIAEYRRLFGPKPVYPFIWAKYHQAAQPPELAGTYATAEDWMLWIENVNKWSDGMMYWGPMDPGPWMDATIQRLMETGP